MPASPTTVMPSRIAMSRLTLAAAKSPAGSPADIRVVSVARDSCPQQGSGGLRVVRARHCSCYGDRAQAGGPDFIDIFNRNARNRDGGNLDLLCSLAGVFEPRQKVAWLC